MSSDPLSVAVAHFQARRFGEARTLLERLASAAQPHPQILLMLAIACRQTGAGAACGAALDRLLAVQPRAVRALLMKGDLALEAGDARGATAFYRRALSEASEQPNLPPDLQQQLRAAHQAVRGAEQRWRMELEERLEEAGCGGEARSSRFQQSLDILYGEKQLYLQQPTLYNFPALPHIQFYETTEFPWVKALESETPAILQELEALVDRQDLFRPYIVSNSERPPSASFHGLTDNPNWSSMYLWSDGAPVQGVTDRCPRTMAALERTPLARMSVRAPVIMFSLLKGGARIAPHHGSTNVRLICHLPIVVPPHCGLRVGNEIREWEVGKLLIFDDTIEHEAWNESQEDRIILIFDVWRPELSPAERLAVTKIFEALDTPPTKNDAGPRVSHEES